MGNFPSAVSVYMVIRLQHPKIPYICIFKINIYNNRIQHLNDSILMYQKKKKKIC